MAVCPYLKWMSDIDTFITRTTIEKVRPQAPLLYTQVAQRRTAGPECHLEALPKALNDINKHFLESRNLKNLQYV